MQRQRAVCAATFECCSEALTVHRQRKDKRLHPEVIETYRKIHPGIDPCNFLKTPFMTEENSEVSGTDQTVSQRRLELAVKAGLTQKEIEDGVKILEMRSFSWRSRKVCSWTYIVSCKC